ncbi:MULTISPECIES: D-ribose pyranase [unclassified Mesobacillus]|jgi:D-ribose pyranase|uniref:D-ribose pyranase n=1 Tax=unclassified Mesobacillus TaxID=2675270 RepID=UPI00203CFCF1|nr:MULTISPECIES: D-ribose pyranase [unclassified Mesobacillus]MCM3123859.1 D-ribose pyranase [Mesobacillus sp. MER 33]MCM3234126.1 D-ribose pyranase [Mesobacillus sp. MER 48]
MKKQGILNSHIAEVLANLGHTDTIVIADCGLPIPDGVKKIDLSLRIGMPGFIETLEAILEDMEVEQVTIADEIYEKNPKMMSFIEDKFSKGEIQSVTHEDFKKKTAQAKTVIRTGEATPYANIILHAGVIF